MFTPAVNASLPELVPKSSLPKANALLQGTNALTTTASFGVGGFLYAAFGAPWLFLINAISYLISAASECFITIRQEFPAERINRRNAVGKFRRETWEGALYVWQHRGLRLLVAMLGLINFVLIPTGIAMPILVRDFLHRGPEFLGILGASQAAGSLLGFIAMGAIKTPPHWRPGVVISGLILCGLLILFLGLVPPPTLLLFSVALFGFLLPLINVNIISLMQGTTPSNIRGRVMGVMGTFVLGLIPLSQGLAGVLIDSVDQQVPVIYLGVGGLCITLVTLAASAPAFRRYLAMDY